MPLLSALTCTSICAHATVHPVRCARQGSCNMLDRVARYPRTHVHVMLLCMHACMHACRERGRPRSHATGRGAVSTRPLLANPMPDLDQPVGRRTNYVAVLACLSSHSSCNISVHILMCIIFSICVSFEDRQREWHPPPQRLGRLKGIILWAVCCSCLRF